MKAQRTEMPRFFLSKRCKQGNKTRRGGAWGAPPRQFNFPNLAPSGFIGVPVRIDGREVLPLFGQVFQRENGGHGANRHASAAINALYWAYIKLGFAFVGWFILARVNAIDGANVHASGIFGADARLSYNVGHHDLLISI
jgi:hypothetical protein